MAINPRIVYARGHGQGQRGPGRRGRQLRLRGVLVARRPRARAEHAGRREPAVAAARARRRAGGDLPGRRDLRGAGPRRPHRPGRRRRRVPARQRGLDPRPRPRLHLPDRRAAEHRHDPQPADADLPHRRRLLLHADDDQRGPVLGHGHRGARPGRARPGLRRPRRAAGGLGGPAGAVRRGHRQAHQGRDRRPAGRARLHLLVLRDPPAGPGRPGRRGERLPDGPPGPPRAENSGAPGPVRQPAPPGAPPRPGDRRALGRGPRRNRLLAQPKSPTCSPPTSPPNPNHPAAALLRSSAAALAG